MLTAGRTCFCVTRGGAGGNPGVPVSAEVLRNSCGSSTCRGAASPYLFLRKARRGRRVDMSGPPARPAARRDPNLGLAIRTWSAGAYPFLRASMKLATPITAGAQVMRTRFCVECRRATCQPTGERTYFCEQDRGLWRTLRRSEAYPFLRPQRDRDGVGKRCLKVARADGQPDTLRGRVVPERRRNPAGLIRTSAWICARRHCA